MLLRPKRHNDIHLVYFKVLNAISSLCDPCLHQLMFSCHYIIYYYYYNYNTKKINFLHKAPTRQYDSLYFNFKKFLSFSQHDRYPTSLTILSSTTFKFFPSKTLVLRRLNHTNRTGYFLHYQDK